MKTAGPHTPFIGQTHATMVERTRTVTTEPHSWDADTQEWVLNPDDATEATETETRELSAEEIAANACEEEEVEEEDDTEELAESGASGNASHTLLIGGSLLLLGAAATFARRRQQRA